jgi:hypothetical protein
MGGRGAASGLSDKGIEYGTEYRTLLAVDNIKFIQRNEGAANAPLETMSAAKGRIYVTVNKQNFLKSITLYDNVGKRSIEIHLRHSHNGLMPHYHVGYDSPHTNDNTFSAAKYEALIRRIERYWREANGK